MMSRFWLVPILVAGALMLAVDARSDGGAVRLRESLGAFTITVFTPPYPIAAGPIDISVLVQDRADGTPILDALVKLRVRPPSGRDDAARMIEATATHDAATNKLLYAASIDAGTGAWSLQVVIQRGHQISSAVVPLSIVPATSRLREHWPHVLLPPVAILLFVLRQWLIEPEEASA